MKLQIIPSYNKDLDDSIEHFLGKWDLLKIVSEKTGLPWKNDLIKIEHQEGNADWRGEDIILSDFRRGIWCLSGVTHELVHLILRQNNWLNSKIIQEFIKEHDELNDRERDTEKKKGGYLIEQMIAYLIQSEVDCEIGEKNKMPEMCNSWNEEKFNKIIENEYRTDFAKKLGLKIREEWKKKKEGENIIFWVESLILAMQ